MKIERFEDLDIWKEARELCKLIFNLTEKEPFCKEFVQFLSLAKGSCGETRSQSYRAYDYQYINEETLEKLIANSTMLSRKISSFMSYLKKSEFKGSKFYISEP
jgi:hypothetical protein